MGKFCVWQETRRLVSHHINKQANQAEVESKMMPYTSAFDDYNEMAIQFGYLTLFAAAFPLAPLAALINNIVEMRTDAFKILNTMQRPNPKGANSIGYWKDILEIISYLAVASNCCLIFITSTTVDSFLANYGIYSRVWMAVGAEHLVIVIKFILSKVIPDTPHWVREAYLRKEYLKEVAEQEYMEEELEKKEKIEDVVLSQSGELIS